MKDTNQPLYPYCGQPVGRTSISCLCTGVESLCPALLTWEETWIWFSLENIREYGVLIVLLSYSWLLLSIPHAPECWAAGFAAVRGSRTIFLWGTHKSCQSETERTFYFFHSQVLNRIEENCIMESIFPFFTDLWSFPFSFKFQGETFRFLK